MEIPKSVSTAIYPLAPPWPTEAYKNATQKSSRGIIITELTIMPVYESKYSVGACVDYKEINFIY